MTKRKPSVHLVLRLPVPLHRQLAGAAEREMRSLNSEILLRLGASLPEPEARPARRPRQASRATATA